MKKLTGSYYTPQILSDFIVEYIFQQKKLEKISILEPSVGDGVFLESLIQNKKIHILKEISLTALDINKTELSKAKKRLLVTDCCENARFINEDFLKFQKDHKDRYSYIIGNPPYIKGARLSTKQIELCQTIHNKAGLAKKRINNIWTSFVISCLGMLKKNGVMAFVLPADILQVKYAEEIRKLLETTLARIEIFTLEKSSFKGTDQQTIVFIGFMNADEKGTFFYSILDIKKNKYQKISSNGLMISENKWTHYNLNPKEIRLLNRLNSEFPRISDFLNSAPGIVTGANKFFIISEKELKKYGLEKYSKPIIATGRFANGEIDFVWENYLQCVEEGHPAYLIALTGKEKLNNGLKKFLKTGTELGLHKRYKCRIRDKWYAIPNIAQPPEAFFFKRSHLFPKIVRNKAEVFVTDTAYKISMKNGYNVESLIYSFYNIVTLIFAELTGRKYGGGVLELTPLEFRNLPIPYKNISEKKYNYFKFALKKEELFSLLLSEERLSLFENIEIDQEEMVMLSSIYNKLLSSRIKKENSTITCFSCVP